MRPQRTAAVAARAAITALSEATADTKEESLRSNANEDVDFAPGGQQLVTFNRTKLQAQNSGGGSSKNRGRKRKHHDEEEDYETLLEPAQLVENPSLFDKLPTEIRMKIATQLDNDIFTIVSCTLVSKNFLSSLSLNRDPEKDWERRCRRMGAKKKSPGSKTWRETYLRIVTKKCGICHKNTTAKLGKLFKIGPRCLVVCEPCQQLPGPYRVISTRALSYLPSVVISKKELAELNWKRRCINEHLWFKEHLFDEVLPIYAEKLRQLLQEADKEFSEEELLSTSQRDLEQTIMACNVDIVQTQYEHQMMTGFLDFL